MPAGGRPKIGDFPWISDQKLVIFHGFLTKIMENYGILTKIMENYGILTQNHGILTKSWNSDPKSWNSDQNHGILDHFLTKIMEFWTIF